MDIRTDICNHRVASLLKYYTLFCSIKLFYFKRYIFKCCNAAIATLNTIKYSSYRLLIQWVLFLDYWHVCLYKQTLITYMSQTHSLPRGTFSCFGHIYVVCGSIWTFLTVLLSRISMHTSVFFGGGGWL